MSKPHSLRSTHSYSFRGQWKCDGACCIKVKGALQCCIGMSFSMYQSSVGSGLMQTCRVILFCYGIRSLRWQDESGASSRSPSLFSFVIGIYLILWCLVTVNQHLMLVSSRLGAMIRVGGDRYTFFVEFGLVYGLKQWSEKNEGFLEARSCSASGASYDSRRDSLNRWECEMACFR
jgi:hypothetical protein